MFPRQYIYFSYAAKHALGQLLARRRRFDNLIG